MKTGILSLAVVFVFVLFGVESANACSCAISSPCLMDARADASFVGTIKSVERKGIAAVHKVEIVRHFDGLEGKKEVEIYTDQASSCSFSMQKDEQYVIFARINEENGMIWTGYCSGTKPLKEALTEVKYLEALKGAPDGRGILTGKILEYDARHRFTKVAVRPKEIGRVYLESENGEKFESRIETDGQYAFGQLKRGYYRVSVVAPERLIENDEIETDYFSERAPRKVIKKVKILGSGCASSSFYSFYVNGIISGKVLDSNNLPLKKMPVTVFRYDDADDMPEKSDTVWTNDEGVYVIKGLPSARYLIGFGLDSSLYINSHFAGYLPAYYPNAARREESKYLYLGDSEILRDRNITLSPQLRKRKLTGQVFDESGQPVKNAHAVFYVRRKIVSDEPEGGYDLKLDAEGKFELEVYDKTEYWILARLFDSEDRPTRGVISSSKCYKVTETENVAAIRITLLKGAKNCDVQKL